MNLDNQIIDLIRNNPRFTQAQPCYVSIYSKSQAYGGAEEGGWWKTYYKLEGSVAFPTREQAEAYVEEVEKLAHMQQLQANAEYREYFLNSYRDDQDCEDDFCIGETCGADEFFVTIEEQQGEMDNCNEPVGHYE